MPVAPWRAHVAAYAGTSRCAECAAACCAPPVAVMCVTWHCCHVLQERRQRLHAESSPGAAGTAGAGDAEAAIAAAAAEARAAAEAAAEEEMEDLLACLGESTQIVLPCLRCTLTRLVSATGYAVKYHGDS